MKLAMRVLACLFIAVIGIPCGFAEEATASANSSASAHQVWVSADYLYQGANRVPGATDWFAANGGRADISFGNWHRLGFVAEVGGMHSSNLTSTGTGQTLLTYLGGPRYSIALSRRERRKVSVFGQVLVGDVHGSDGLFPGGTQMKTSEDAFAMSAGGGLEAGFSHRISLRLIQADYLYTHLPNHYDSYESSFRIGAGVAFRLH